MKSISVIDVPKLIGTNRFTKQWEVKKILQNMDKKHGKTAIHKKDYAYSAGIGIAYGWSPCIHGCIMEETTLSLAGGVRYDKYITLEFYRGYEMIGKLDGVKLDDYGKIKEIIECKNRVSKFGNYQHDIDQVLLYLYIVCTNEKNKTIVARLVQQLGDEIITDTYTYEDAEKRYWEIRKALIPKLNA